MQKASPKAGFDSLTVASRYTECAVPAQCIQYYAFSNRTKFQQFVGGGQGIVPSSSLTYPKGWDSTPLPNVNVYQST